MQTVAFVGDTASSDDLSIDICLKQLPHKVAGQAYPLALKPNVFIMQYLYSDNKEAWRMMFRITRVSVGVT